MDEDAFKILLDSLERERQKLFEHQQVLGDKLTAQIAQATSLQGQLLAVQYLAYALARNHPQLKAVAEEYMTLMDHAGDHLPKGAVQFVQPHMQTVLQELLRALPPQASE
jgi:hypothetical protein